jgi:hypothetical protein
MSTQTSFNDLIRFALPGELEDARQWVLGMLMRLPAGERRSSVAYPYVHPQTILSGDFRRVRTYLSKWLDVAAHLQPTGWVQSWELLGVILPKSYVELAIMAVIGPNPITDDDWGGDTAANIVVFRETHQKWRLYGSRVVDVKRLVASKHDTFVSFEDFDRLVEQYRHRTQGKW